ncbi:MAG TPA: SDR family oxidoreductase [Mycobacteriales bacterium]|nr:SDR family oxidoreductase [Mycobacteriales bacterium]
MNGGRFEDRVALVTGAGSGIGRATALRLAAEGARVLAVDINEVGLKETVELGGASIVPRPADVTIVAECQAAVGEAIAQFGKLNLLGNIAGISGNAHMTEVTEAEYRRMFGVNVDAYFFLAQAAIPHLLETNGVIINIASNAGLMGQAYSVLYTMTKGAVVQLTKSLAMEYIKRPLRVVAIAPGGTDTALVRNFSMPDDVDWDLVGRYTSPRGFAKPEDIAALFCFLASDEARNIHGAIVSSDNGITAG